MDFIANIAPSEVSKLIVNTLNEAMIFKQGTLIAVIGLVITIALSANAIAAIIKGLNRAYAIEETRSFLYTRTLAVLMVFINSLVLFLAVDFIVLGKVLLDFMLSNTILSQLSIDIIAIVRWPVSYLALTLLALGNYYILPAIEGNDRIRFRSILPGTFFFSLFWMLGSWCFSLYLSNLNAYNKVYSAIGAVAILMVWMYYSSLIMLIGGEINSRVYEKLINKKKNNE